jgi:hypothetical protein
LRYAQNGGNTNQRFISNNGTFNERVQGDEQQQQHIYVKKIDGYYNNNNKIADINYDHDWSRRVVTAHHYDDQSTFNHVMDRINN